MLIPVFAQDAVEQQAQAAASATVGLVWLAIILVLVVAMWRVFERAGQPLDRAAMEAVAFSVGLRRYLRTSAKASPGKPLSYFAQSLAFLPADNDK